MVPSPVQFGQCCAMNGSHFTSLANSNLPLLPQPPPLRFLSVAAGQVRLFFRELGPSKKFLLVGEKETRKNTSATLLQNRTYQFFKLYSYRNYCPRTVFLLRSRSFHYTQYQKQGDDTRGFVQIFLSVGLYPTFSLNWLRKSYLLASLLRRDLSSSFLRLYC